MSFVGIDQLVGSTAEDYENHLKDTIHNKAEVIVLLAMLV